MERQANAVLGRRVGRQLRMIGYGPGMTTADRAPPVRVLVVDDEVPLAGVVASYLVREGYAVSQAHDGPTAVAAARDSAPDLIVLDVMLPVSTGSRCAARSARSPTPTSSC